MTKKSAAQIRRLQKRAETRGETYECPPPPPEKEPDNKEGAEQHNDKRLGIAKKLAEEVHTIESNENLKSKDRRAAKRKAEAIAAEESGMDATELLAWYEQQQQVDDSSSSKRQKRDANQLSPEVQKQLKVAERLVNELKDIESNETLKAKDRRSAKRKAEAIATEETGMSSEDLLTLYQKHQPKDKSAAKTKTNRDPYIAFVGQMAYDTTKEQLFAHIQEQLKDELPAHMKITPQNCTIRLLTEKKNPGKSRGMAFVQVDNPELLYALLKLHQTFLHGRRINVERSAGGSKDSKARQAKLSNYRQQQAEYFDGVVDRILGDYRKTGELREDELDDGVIRLAKRHSGPIVKAAVAKYIEGGGRDMDNPSAYLTFLMTKFAEEGIYDEETSNSKKHTGKPKPKRGREDRKGGGGFNKKSSEFLKSGIDMSMSETRGHGGGGKGIGRVFPSARRGRGYMM